VMVLRILRCGAIYLSEAVMVFLKCIWGLIKIEEYIQ